MDTPVMMATGCPLDSTWVAPTTHCPVTHGPLPAGGTNAQPTTAYGAAIVAIGIPETKTVGLGTVGIAWPPCAGNDSAHVENWPGHLLTSLFTGCSLQRLWTGYGKRGLVQSDDWTIRLIVAPCPLLM